MSERYFDSIEEWYLRADIFAYRYGVGKYYMRKRLKRGDFDFGGIPWSQEYERLSEGGKVRCWSKLTHEDLGLISNELYRMAKERER